MRDDNIVGQRITLKHVLPKECHSTVGVTEYARKMRQVLFVLCILNGPYVV